MTKINLNRKLIYTGALLLVCVLLMVSSYYNPTQLLKLREKGYLLGSFFYSISFGSKQTLTNLIENITQTKRIRKENQRLRTRIDELIFRQENYYQEIILENQRLRELLNFEERTPFELTPAKVVSYSPQDFFKVVYLNKGKQDGVKEAMEVVNPKGLVGKVVEVYSTAAKVMLVVDKRNKVGVRVKRTRDIGILQGTGDPQICELNYILTKAEVKKGDQIVTSGLGGIYSPGIVVGYISYIQKNPNYIFQQIKVEPAVDFGQLGEVFLVKEEQ